MEELFYFSGEVSGGTFWGLGGAWGAKMALDVKCVETYVFFCQKWCDRVFRLHETRATLTVYRTCAQKLVGHRGEGRPGTLMDILS